MSRYIWESEPVIGYLGDVHGNWRHVEAALAQFHRLGVRMIFQLGDFGFIWPGEPVRRRLDAISGLLEQHDQVLLWIDGNHEGFSLMQRFVIDRTPGRLLDPVTGFRGPGIEWNADRLGHLERGWRTTLSNGMTLGALGGAGSIDRSHRVVGLTWWPEEEITETDLVALGVERLDILIGHEAPTGLSATDGSQQHWNFEDWLMANKSRAMYMRAFQTVQPRLSLSGHWHLFTSELITTRAAIQRDTSVEETFDTRAVILDRDTPGGLSLATLDLRTLDLRAFTAFGRELTSDADWRSIPERSMR